MKLGQPTQKAQHVHGCNPNGRHGRQPTGLPIGGYPTDRVTICKILKSHINCEIAEKKCFAKKCRSIGVPFRLRSVENIWVARHMHHTGVQRPRHSAPATA
jgi:hypothetical protein